MRLAHCLQHVPFEGPGIFKLCLERHGYEVRQHLVPEQGLPSELGDFLLIMGGPMSVNDPDPWIADELIFIQAALSKNIPVVGVCFGSQLITRALGTSVTPSEYFEIGLVPITLSEDGHLDSVFQSMPRTFDVFQWHGEGFELPQNTVLLASSERYPVQAYRYGTHVYAFLFHLELDVSGVEMLCRECPEDVTRGGVSPEVILSKSAPAFPQLHDCAGRLIAHLASDSI
ncbi:MAG: type 1 glutamine amidotransferase [Nitrospirales bacterium]